MVLVVEYVNLAVGARIFDLDGEGSGSYRSSSLPDDGIDGAVRASSIERLEGILRRAKFCSMKPPEEEPMTFTVVSVDFPGMTCRKKMTPEAWRRRHPDIVREIAVLEEEVCGGRCDPPSSLPW